MKIYGVYDLRNKEQCMRIGDIGEIAEFLNLTARMFDGVIRKRSISKEVRGFMCV